MTLPILLLTVSAVLLVDGARGQSRPPAPRMDVHEAVKKGLVEVTFLCSETNVTIECRRKTQEPVVLLFKKAPNGLIQFGVGDFTKIKGATISNIKGEMVLSVESADGDVDSKWGVLLQPEKDEQVVDLTASESGTVVVAPCRLHESFSPDGGPRTNPKAVKQGKFILKTNEKGKVEMLWGPSTSYCPATN